MKVTKTLAPRGQVGSSKPHPVVGESVFVRQGPVLLASHRMGDQSGANKPPVTLNTGDSVTWPEFDQLILENSLDIGVEVILEVGYGVITRSQGELSATVTEIVQPVQVGNVVKVTSDKPLEAKFPDQMQVAPVEVANLDQISREVEVKGVVPMSPKAYGSFVPRPAHEFADTQDHIVPKNEARKELLIRADKNNKGVVWTGPSVGVGHPIEPGDPASFFMDDALPLYAEELGDTVYIIEVEE